MTQDPRGFRGLIIALTSIFLVGCGRGSNHDFRTYYMTFGEPLPALEVGASIKAGGIVKGTVRRVAIEDGPTPMRIELEVAEDVIVTRSTRARIVAPEPFGPFFIELYGTDPAEPRLPIGATIRSAPR